MSELGVSALFLCDAALEEFIAGRLLAAGVWESARTSDGIVHARVVDRAADILRICGQIYTIDQDLHSFWLDVARDTESSRVRWDLYFDVVAKSSRRARDAIVVADRADQLEWTVILLGLATVGDGELAVESWEREGSEAP